MTTRYCSTCGALLSPGAVICGECGARYQQSPYERRATDAPGAWSPPPRPRLTEDEASASASDPEDPGIERISRDALEPAAPGATTLRPPGQYDRMMVTQPGPGPSADPAGPHPLPQESVAADAVRLDPPLDDCVAAPPLKRLLAALVDGIILAILDLPLLIVVIVLLVTEEATLLVQVLVGVGAALPLAYQLVMIWLQGAKGFTLGKLALGLRTVREGQGGPIGVLRSLGRTVLLGICVPIFAATIFIDPKRQLRGAHDRAVGSVVADARVGRNPMQPRPDDFERESAEHYLGASSVAVSAPESLMASPGAAWSAPEAPSAPSAAESRSEGPAEAAAGHPSAPPAPGPQPVAPQAPGSEASGWGAAPPAPEAPIESTPWAAPPAVSPPPTTPPPPAAPAPEPPHVPASDAGSAPDPIAQWAPPPSPAPAPASAPAPSPSAEQQKQSVPEPWAPPAPGAGAQAVWPGDDVDEATRLTAHGQEPEDLEATRVSAAVPPRLRKLRITADDGTARVVERPVVVGRNPSGAADELMIVLKDETRSVSKTHLRIDGTGEDLVLTDLGSTNGSAIVHADGSRDELAADSPTTVPGPSAGMTIAIGDRTLTVEREQ